MKKILLTSIAVVGWGASAFGIGQVLFENSNLSSAYITLDLPGNLPTGSGLVVDLLWDNGSSFVLVNTFTSTFTADGNGYQGPGYFSAGVVTLPNFQLRGTFEIEASYTYNGTEYSGTTGAFTAVEGEGPPAPPQPLASFPTGPETSDWYGTMVLEAVPEPASIALGGLGVAVLLLFRHRTWSNLTNKVRP